MPNVIDIKQLGVINIMNSHYKDEYFRVFGKRHSFATFVSYCHAYAKYLLNQSSFNVYDIFIDAFNSVVKNDETYKFHQKVQKCIFLSRNYEKLLIQDERIQFEKCVFKYERDLENVIFQDFIDYYGDEKSIKRQEYLGYGKSDISIDGKFAIELKIGKAKRKDIYQTFEYSFAENIENVCLIAKDIDNNVLKIANKLKVDCYSYSLVKEDDIEDSYPIGVYFEKITNSKTNNFDEYLQDIGGLTLFSFYNPKFDFTKVLQDTVELIDDVTKITVEIHETEVKRLLEILKVKGCDISKGLEHAAKEYELKLAK